MPTILYKWDFETGDTQGWILGSYSTLDSTSQIQGTYSIYFRRESTTSLSEHLVMYISGVDLSYATKPILILVARDRTHNPYSPYIIRQTNIKVVVKKGASVLLSLTSREIGDQAIGGGSIDVTKVFVFDLSPIAGESGLTIELYVTGYTTSTVIEWRIYFDNIHIVDGVIGSTTSLF
jgi:hypothetical protein